MPRNLSIAEALRSGSHPKICHNINTRIWKNLGEWHEAPNSSQDKYQHKRVLKMQKGYPRSRQLRN